MRICVVALGKIGLPLAVQFASKGHRVVGADVDERVVADVSAGREPFPGEDGLGRRLAAAVADGRLAATTDTAAAVAESEAVVVVVPLFVDAAGVPDFGGMDAATRSIAEGLRPGTLVSYETTLPVGTTRNRWMPMLADGSGLTAGAGFHLVFSPERVLTGRVFADLRRYPKLVGGVDDASARRGVAFYEQVLDFDERPDLERANGVWDLGSAEAAELAKLAETTYRDVNIGLANQFARHADAIGVDVAKVIEACNTQPYSRIHRPGIAVGGHCIPIYPRMYLWNDPDATIVRAARDANEAMPEYAVGLLAGAYGDLTGAAVLVLGAAYRGGVKETAFSGVFPTVEALRARGAAPYVSDPMYTAEELEGLGLPPHRGEPVAAAIVQADHAEYRDLGAADLPGVKALVDGRRVTDPAGWRGVTRVVIGAPDGEGDARTSR
ncbi:nucleotide sugar dehydrogenase [Actinomadura livida]|uniref:Nucleotide sugar dehydrogenase n=1 Tax=Actinomadura livida TaxID=79909 RepID=A0A7W7ICP7_9ACTN|nr:MULTISPECIES: nucleotide sugar dehydrogenase [Actinomadura]MBB4774643.1 nucleotide sugar dehydrogenase [Actinomadura catellatispora]GGU06968.1 nucleotide sugar dehydrogenase [Actinomadura livida]